MTIKQLVEQLQQIDNQELKVVLNVEVDGDYMIFQLETVDLGWEPSGVVSLGSSTCIGE